MKQKATFLFRSFCLLLTIVLGTSALKAQGAQSLTIDESRLERAEGYINETVTAAVLHVHVANTTEDVSIRIAGSNTSVFSLSQTSIPAGTHDVELTISYNPIYIGTHKATIVFESDTNPALNKSLAITGIAVDRNNMPTVTLVAPPTTFNTVVNTPQKQSLEFQVKNLPDNGTIRMQSGKGYFTINNSTLYKYSPKVTLNVTFNPLKAGTFKDTIVVAAYKADTIRIALEGVATGGVTPQEREGDDISKLSEENAVTHFEEYFNDVEKNKPLALEQFTNLANIGTRAFWGYVFGETDELPGEKAAKVTGFDSKVVKGEEEPCEMILFTPCIDFKNATSKMFTFRVRGDLLNEKQTDKIALFYNYKNENGELKSEAIGNVPFPTTADQAGEWNELHIDFTPFEMPDKFWLSFGFASNRGTLNSAVYYLDDITFGRTDIPVIRPNATEKHFEAIIDEPQAVAVEVTTENLTQPIKLSLGGANPSKFKLTTKELPAEGGTFGIGFQSSEKGVHSAYVKLASRGAADQYILLEVNNTTDIHTVDATQQNIVEVYTLQGEKKAVYKGMKIDDIIQTLDKGVYIFKNQTNTRKIVVR